MPETKTLPDSPEPLYVTVTVRDAGGATPVEPEPTKTSTTITEPTPPQEE